MYLGTDKGDRNSIQLLNHAKSIRSLSENRQIEGRNNKSSLQSIDDRGAITLSKEHTENESQERISNVKYVNDYDDILSASKITLNVKQTSQK
jgi:hypothetical protein